MQGGAHRRDPAPQELLRDRALFWREAFEHGVAVGVARAEALLTLAVSWSSLLALTAFEVAAGGSLALAAAVRLALARPSGPSSSWPRRRSRRAGWTVWAALTVRSGGGLGLASSSFTIAGSSRPAVAIRLCMWGTARPRALGRAPSVWAGLVAATAVTRSVRCRPAPPSRELRGNAGGRRPVDQLDPVGVRALGRPRWLDRHHRDPVDTELRLRPHDIAGLGGVVKQRSVERSSGV